MQTIIEQAQNSHTLPVLLMYAALDTTYPNEQTPDSLSLDDIKHTLSHLPEIEGRALLEEMVEILEAVERLEKKVAEHHARMRPDQLNMFTGELEHPDTRWHKQIADLKYELHVRKQALAFTVCRSIAHRHVADAIQERVQRALDSSLESEFRRELERDGARGRPRTR